jgi:DNA-binding SARP family transcriptional activator
LMRADRRASRRRTHRVSIRAFGPLSISDGRIVLGPRDQGGRKPRRLLHILISARGHPVPKARLADMLWEAEPLPRYVTASLETHVSVLRAALSALGGGRDLIVTEPGAYRLASELVDLDLDRFDELVSEPPRSGPRPELVEALDLARGIPFEDEPDAAWARALRNRYVERVRSVRLDLAASFLTDRAFARALELADEVAARDAGNERACRLAMIAEYGLGKQEAALRRFSALLARLRESQGVDPLPETAAIHLAILQQRPVPALLSPVEAGTSLGPTGGPADALGEALRSNEAQLEAAYRAVPLPTFTWKVEDDDLVLIGTNEAGERLVDWRWRDYADRRASEMFAHEPDILDDFRRVVASGERRERAMTYLVPGTDEPLDLRVTYVPLPLDWVVVHVENLTEARRAREALHETEALVNTLLETAEGAIVIADTTTNEILAANDRAATLLGYEPSQFRTTTLSHIYQVHVDDPLATFRSVTETGRAWTGSLAAVSGPGAREEEDVSLERIAFSERRMVLSRMRPTEGRATRRKGDALLRR